MSTLREQFLQSWAPYKLTGLTEKSIRAVLDLAESGATVPFIARYRKEVTGNLDEVSIRSILECWEDFKDFEKRKAFILSELQKQDVLSSKLRQAIENVFDLNELEEIYRPYKKAKTSRAQLARKAGLEPLAHWIWSVGRGELPEDPPLEVKAKEFLNPKAQVITYEQAIEGAKFLLIEQVVSHRPLRQKVIEFFWQDGKLVSKRAKGYKVHSKYSMYADYQCRLRDLLLAKNSHRYLAMKRGESDEELEVSIECDLAPVWKHFEEFVLPSDSKVGQLLKEVAHQSLHHYILPSIKNEIHRRLKEAADKHAIHVFTRNVKKVLMSPPFGSKMVLGVDPGVKTGCKVALVDRSGQYLSHTVIFPDKEGALEEAKVLFKDLFRSGGVEAIAVGNGTGSRQAESFFRKLVKEMDVPIPVIVVNEAGASVYSASEVAREEFPDLDVTVRGSISIARRLQDPLSELVKIDPKSLGVGQYQHDVNQSILKKSLHAVVEDCVNQVGVDLNTASPQLLAYVAGVGEKLAKNIIEYRKQKLFEDRFELLKVPQFNQKHFEQAAGFLRIRDGKYILDSTGIHPERYEAVRDMAKDLGVGVRDLLGEGAKKLEALRSKYVPLIGEYTFEDIIRELEKPGRDPRDPFQVVKFRDDISELKDVKVGMICPGIVTNVTNFGAFVDIGIHQDGLVHLSAFNPPIQENPEEIVAPGDIVTVRVIGVDLEKNQLSLSFQLEPPKLREKLLSKVRSERYRNTLSREQEPKGTESRDSVTSDRSFRSSQKVREKRGEKGITRKSPAKAGNQAFQKPAFNNPFASLKALTEGLKSSQDSHDDSG